MNALACVRGDEQRCVAGQRVALVQVAFAGVGFELHDGARRQRAHGQRVKLFEQGIAEFGVVVVQPALQAGGQQRETFEQALDMRVGALSGGQLQAPGDLGVALGEQTPGMPQPGQFALVIVQQLRVNRVAHVVPQGRRRRAR